MDWQILFICEWFGKLVYSNDELGCSVFYKDYDWIIFFGVFCCFGCKIQVYLVFSNDYIYICLIYFLEVVCVGCLLGMWVGEIFCEELFEWCDFSDFGVIVQLVCLVYDIGNLLFGYFGEDVICNWFQ